jgi:hypothetical protein
MSHFTPHTELSVRIRFPAPSAPVGLESSSHHCLGGGDPEVVWLRWLLWTRTRCNYPLSWIERGPSRRVSRNGALLSLGDRCMVQALSTWACGSRSWEVGNLFGIEVRERPYWPLVLRCAILTIPKLHFIRNDYAVDANWAVTSESLVHGEPPSVEA